MLYWPDDTVVLRLRIVHLSVMDLDDFIAETKVREAGDRGGSSDEGFIPVATFMFAPIAFEIDGEQTDLHEFPEIYRDEFIAMVKQWGRVTRVMECGEALGEKLDCSDVSRADADNADREQL